MGEGAGTHLVVGRRLRLRRRGGAALHGGGAPVGGRGAGLAVLVALAQDRPVERVVVLVVHRAEQDAEQLRNNKYYRQLVLGAFITTVTHRSWHPSLAIRRRPNGMSSRSRNPMRSN